MIRDTEGFGAVLGITDMLGVTSPRNSAGYRASESRAPVSFSYLPDGEFDRRFCGYDGWADPDTGKAYIRQSIRGSPYERVVKLHELYELMYPDAEHGQLHRWVLDFLKGTDPEAYKAGMADLKWKKAYGGPEGRRFAEDVLGNYFIAPASYDGIRAGRGMPGDGDEKSYRQREGSGPNRRIIAAIERNKEIKWIRDETNRIRKINGLDEIVYDQLLLKPEEFDPKNFHELTDYLEVLPEYVLPTWFGPEGWVSGLKKRIESFELHKYSSGTLRNLLYGDAKDKAARYFTDPKQSAFGRFSGLVNG